MVAKKQIAKKSKPEIVGDEAVFSSVHLDKSGKRIAFTQDQEQIIANRARTFYEADVASEAKRGILSKVMMDLAKFAHVAGAGKEDLTETVWESVTKAADRWMIQQWRHDNPARGSVTIKEVCASWPVLKSTVKRSLIEYRLDPHKHPTVYQFKAAADAAREEAKAKAGATEEGGERGARAEGNAGAKSREVVQLGATLTGALAALRNECGALTVGQQEAAAAYLAETVLPIIRQLGKSEATKPSEKKPAKAVAGAEAVAA